MNGRPPPSSSPARGENRATIRRKGRRRRHTYIYIYRHKGIQHEVDSHLEWEVYIYVTIYICCLLPPTSPLSSSGDKLLSPLSPSDRKREEVRRRRRRIKGRRSHFGSSSLRHAPEWEVRDLEPRRPSWTRIGGDADGGSPERGAVYSFSHPPTPE